MKEEKKRRIISLGKKRYVLSHTIKNILLFIAIFIITKILDILVTNNWNVVWLNETEWIIRNLVFLSLGIVFIALITFIRYRSKYILIESGYNK